MIDQITSSVDCSILLSKLVYFSAQYRSHFW